MNKHDLMYCTPILNQIVFVALEIWVENGFVRKVQKNFIVF